MSKTINKFQKDVNSHFEYRKMSLISMVDHSVLESRSIAPAIQPTISPSEINKNFSHTSHVTSICCIPETKLIATASRDKKIILWEILEEDPYLKPIRFLTGHSHFIQQVVSSKCGKYLLSASWDRSARLWY